MQYRVVAATVVGLVAICALCASLAAVTSGPTSPLRVSSQMRAVAKTSCRAALPGARVLAGTPITVGAVRAFPPRTHAIGGRAIPRPHAFPTLSKNQVVAWCWTHGTRAHAPMVAYVVAPGYKPLEIDVRFPEQPTTSASGSPPVNAPRSAVSLPNVATVSPG